MRFMQFRSIPSAQC